MLSELRFIKWVRFLEQNCKMSDLFASFYWLWDFLQENLKIIDKLQIWGFKHSFSGPNFVFLGLRQGILASIILKFIRPCICSCESILFSFSNLVKIMAVYRAITLFRMGFFLSFVFLILKIKYNNKMWFHKNCNTQLQIYTTFRERNG